MIPQSELGANAYIADIRQYRVVVKDVWGEVAIRKTESSPSHKNHETPSSYGYRDHPSPIIAIHLFFSLAWQIFAPTGKSRDHLCIQFPLYL